MVSSRALGCILIVGACAGAPSYMHASGVTARREQTLGWVLIIISFAVLALVTILLLVGAIHPPTRSHDPHVVDAGGHREVRWIIAGGIIMPIVVLTAVFVYTVVTLAAVARPSRPPTVHIAVIGHRWWWEVQYASPTGDSTVITANEIHVPVNEPVQIELMSADVIHSFWVPQLAGKTDVVPGERNRMWLEATRAGTYRGQCAEYCGVQHAHMALYVIAEPRAAFDRWLAVQRAAASPPRDSITARAQAVFARSACAGCHTIRGTPAAGRIGPDLTHLASRRTIAAGLLPNTRGNLAGWIADAQGMKPGNDMPTMQLAPADLQLLLTYLGGLR